MVSREVVVRQRIVFWLGVGILVSQAAAAILMDREAQATLVTAALGLFALPVLLTGERK